MSVVFGSLETFVYSFVIFFALRTFVCLYLSYSFICSFICLAMLNMPRSVVVQVAHLGMTRTTKLQFINFAWFVFEKTPPAFGQKDTLGRFDVHGHFLFFHCRCLLSLRGVIGTLERVEFPRDQYPYLPSPSYPLPAPLTTTVPYAPC